MAEFFDAMTSDGTSESSMVDSIMMPILHSAINRAHGRVHSRDGDLQRLAEQSKFCDLAVMQLDACVSCLQSANDDREFHRQTTADLTEIRDRLLDRLTETERAIADKDNELQRLRNSVRNPRSRKEEKKILEENWKADLENVQDGDPIGSEINLIKETIDVAMVVMQNAISVSDARPCELQFCFEMEKEIMTTLFAGFARDFQSRSEQKSVKSSENWSSLGSFSGLMDDLSSLRCKLERFAGSMAEAKSKNSSIKIQEKGTKEESIDGGVNKVSMIIKAHETVIQKKSDKLDAIKESNRKKCQETDELLMCVQRLIQRLESCTDMNLNHEIGQSKRIMRSADSQDSNLRGAITEEILTLLLRCVMKDFQQHMHLITNKSIEKANTRDGYSEELNWQAVVTGEIQSIVLRYVIKDFQQHMLDQVKLVVGQVVSMDLFRGAVNDAEEWNMRLVIAGEVQTSLLRCVMEDFQHLMHDHELTNSIRQVVLMGFFLETIKNELNEKMVDHWKHNEELRTVCSSLIASETRLHIESAVREKVYTLALKDISNAYTIEKEKSTSVDNKGRSSFIQKLDSLLCCSEEENLLLGPSSDSEKEHNVEYYIIQESEHEALMIEENDRETNFNSACDKFKRALMQLGTSKMILKDLGSDQAADLNDGDNEGSDHNVNLEVTNGPKTNHITGFGISLREFSQVITDLENVLHQKLDINFVRLAMVKNQLLQFVGSASLLRMKESLYKQAFIRRCENLQKAENEVDILGDQLDSLLCLLERIYKTLQYHAPALQQCSGVLNILTLIKKELNRVMA